MSSCKSLDDSATSNILVFFVNGKKIVERNVDPEWTLLTYLRKHLRLTGAKLGCGEGGCGACTVMLSRYDYRLQITRHYSVNACLTPVASVHGTAVTTVEGIGSVKTGLHAVQERLAKAHGSQCGFCTPGIVMSMYVLLRNKSLPSLEDINQHLTGNLRRCTGYRAIMDGFSSFASGSAVNGCSAGAKCCKMRQNNGDIKQNGPEPVSNGNVSKNGLGNGHENGIGNRHENGIVNGHENGHKTVNGNVTCDHHDYLKSYDSSQEIIFPPELKMLSEQLDGESLMFQGSRVTYWRPTALSQLLKLKNNYPDAKITVGNTEVGIEVFFKKQIYPVLINPCLVPEMTKTEVNETGIKFGAAVTLTNLQHILTEQVNNLPEYRTRTFCAVLEMLKWFAGQQIRNTASIGGNIMTSSPNSDLNPIFLGTGVTLHFVSLDGARREIVMDDRFFTGYRTNAARPNEVLESITLPYSHKDEFIKTYKQSRRRDDDIAIVNAAMKVRVNRKSNAVDDIVLVFGGLDAKTVLAESTMKKLAGSQWDNSLLEKAINLLMDDLPLSASAPGGMVEYRRALTLSFFFKFYLSVRGWLSKRVPQLVSPLTASEVGATTTHHPSYNYGTQDFDRIGRKGDENYPVGEPFVHASAYKQVTGEAVYIDDISHTEGELHAALVVSSRAHAKILNIDATAALRIEGVEAFFCAKDLPGEENKMGTLTKDEEVFARDEVFCVGQVLGIVVAKDPATARLAASKVEIMYQNLDGSIITIEDAIRRKSWWGPWTVRQGNTAKGFEKAAHILEGEMRMGGQEHFYLEPNAHIAVPKGEDDEIEVFSSSQTPSGTQMQVAQSLGIPANRVLVRVKRLGGAFGGKESRPLCASIPVAVAAFRLQKPVRITLDRQEDMLITGGRHPFLCRWKVGVTNDGEYTALEADLYSNAGCAFDVSSIIMHKALFCIDNAYRHENIRVTGYVRKTNLPSNTAMRGCGAPQAIMFAEDIISRVASYLKLDQSLVRERNMYKTGDKTHINHTLKRCTIQRCWKQVIQQSHLNFRESHVKKFNKDNVYRKRGIAVIPTKCGVAFDRILNQAGALVQIYTDGSVLVTHGGVEMGQGLHTKMIQIASQVLRISVDFIHISDTATDKVPNSSPTAASISSDIYGMAIVNACTELLSRLKPYSASNPKGQWKAWVFAAYADRISLSATGFYRIEEVTDYDFDNQCGQPFHYYTNGAAVTEVEIDCLTGDHTILRTDIVMDVGNSLNPAIDIGQVEGAFVQGAGLVTLEELRYSPDGTLLTRGPGAYKIPSFQDIPCEFHVSLLKDAPNPLAVFSSKGVGEPPLLLATSVFQAIKAAITSARADQGLDTVFRMDSPATAERIRLACQGPLIKKLTKKMDSEVHKPERPWSITV